MKKCTKCKKTFKLIMFGKCKSAKDGLHPHCKLCIKEYNDKVYFKKHNKPRRPKLTPEEKKKKLKQYYKEYYKRPEIKKRLSEKTRKKADNNKPNRIRQVLIIKFRQNFYKATGKYYCGLCNIFHLPEDFIKKNNYCKSCWSKHFGIKNYNKYRNTILDVIGRQCEECDYKGTALQIGHRYDNGADMRKYLGKKVSDSNGEFSKTWKNPKWLNRILYKAQCGNCNWSQELKKDKSTFELFKKTQRFCNKCKQNKTYFYKSQSKCKECMRKYQREPYLIILKKIGNKCVICNSYATNIDHIKNDGAEIRKKIGNNQEWRNNMDLSKEELDKKYQPMCVNCNQEKKFNTKIKHKKY